MSRMLYKHPGKHPMHGDFFDYVVIEEDEIEAHLEEGWSMTTHEAKDKDIIEADIGNDAPTREELEQKANELGIQYRANISDEKLFSRIEEALNELD